MMSAAKNVPTKMRTETVSSLRFEQLGKHQLRQNISRGGDCDKRRCGGWLGAMSPVHQSLADAA